MPMDVGLTSSWLRSVFTVMMRPERCRLTIHCRCKAIFVDTDGLPAYDSRVGDLVQNAIEGDLVRQITETLLCSGVQEDQIGILSLYRQQVKLLSHLLQSYKGIEILTADRSQGRDKDCIIISMVRSNDTGQVCFSLSLHRQQA